MLRSATIDAAPLAAVTFTTGAFAQPAQLGTAAEAAAMLDRAVAAVKADRAKALASFNAGTDGFKDRDLQPFCFSRSDGKLAASTVPKLVGTDIRALKDKSGEPFGEKIFEAAIEGQRTEVRYMFPRPGETVPVQKVSFVTGVGDLGCGVGYHP